LSANPAAIPSASPESLEPSAASRIFVGNISMPVSFLETLSESCKAF
jgi:hypothetical protein